jgi:molecular chaperone DnaJ
MATDFYMVLGVPNDASAEQIKAAYRQRVKELHPDHYGPDARPFLEVQEAYSNLADRRRRDEFDRHKASRRRTQGAAPRRSDAEPMRDPRRETSAWGGDPGRAFGLAAETARFTPSHDELFDRLWSNFTLRTRPKAERVESLTIEVVLSPEEAMRGGSVRIRLPNRERCSACDGHGAVGFYQCWECEGSGAITREFPIEVAYPAGMHGEYVARVPLSRWGIGNFYLSVWFRVSEKVE